MAEDGTRAGPPPSLFLLSLASSLSPFGMIVIVPALGAVAARYGIGSGDAQWLIAVYLFGLGVGQPVTGALSDRYGRRPVIMLGFALFTLASAACMLAPSFATLVAARFVQALGVSVGTVGARAIVRDTHDAIGAAQALAWIGAAMGVAPVVGPLVGGTLGATWGPPAIFAASAVLGLATTAWLGTRLVETRVATATDAESQGWVTSYRQLFGSGVFMGFTLMYAFTQGCFFAFLAVGAAVFQEDLGLGPQAFGATWGAMGLVYVAAAVSGARLGARLGARRALLASGLVATLAGWLLFVATVGGEVTLVRLLGPLVLLMAAAGIQTPLAIAGSVNHRPDIAGTASGLSSSIALAASGAFSILAGTIYAGSFAPVALVIALSATMTLVTYRMTTRG